MIVVRLHTWTMNLRPYLLELTSEILLGRVIIKNKLGMILLDSISNSNNKEKLRYEQ